MKKYFKLMRIKHYIKNLTVFLPLVFSRELFDTRMLLTCLCGILAFCFASSAVYTINDIMDVKSDRLHPTKRFRPIASGEISIKQAIITAVFLVLLCAAACMPLLDSGPLTLLIIPLYLVLNFFYSAKLKSVPIADISILASGYLLRVLFGSAITGIPISHWLYLTVLSIAFYLGLGKRRNEYRRQDPGAAGTRDVLSLYSYEFLDKMMYLCLGLTITFYSLWSVDSAASGHEYGSYIVATVALVIVICMRYSLVVEGASDGDPVEVLFQDKPLLILSLAYAFSMLLIIYLPQILEYF